MIQLSQIDDLACLKNSDQLITDINEIISFIHSKGGQAYTQFSLTLSDGLLKFELPVSIPARGESSIMRKSKMPNKFLESFREAIENN